MLRIPSTAPTFNRTQGFEGESGYNLFDNAPANFGA
jgi:hypothetical protein